MEELGIVSQKKAMNRLRELGLSRRAAYYQLTLIPSRLYLDQNVYSRVDVELLRESLTSRYPA